MDESHVFISYWVPMRVTYGRELQVQIYLNSIGIETFIPMQYKVIDNNDGSKKRDKVPAIKNLIFIHSDVKSIKNLKRESKYAQPLRFYMKTNNNNSTKEILLVPNKQMNDFIKVANCCDNVIFLNKLENSQRKNKRVRIIDGNLAGIEGTVKRVDKNKK